ncbi:hypothetical protein V493_05199 [Pseudogymnoascus sp. VKM F-4281 (FW-2241)]|nr:hypothetical protein V493_05199 [Pseudogymnoascus sp. VKM F-4281 (FW-2241)]
MRHYPTAEMSSHWGQLQVALSPTDNLWVITGPSGAGKSRVGRYLGDLPEFIFIEGDDFLTPAEKANSGVVDGERHTEILDAIIGEAIKERQASPGTVNVVVACSALRVADRNAWRDAVSSVNDTIVRTQRQQLSYSPSFEYTTRPNRHGDLYPADNQVPYFQGAPNPYTQNNGYYSGPSSGPPSVLDIPTPAIRPIHLHFVVLDISEQLSLETVTNRQIRDGHFVSPTAVPAQFRKLQKPKKWERDCYKQECLVASELKVAVRQHIAGVVGGWTSCTCKLCVP